MKLVIFTLFFCSSAECSSLDATAPRRRMQWSGHRPGHNDQVQYLRRTRNGAAGDGLGTMIKYL
jgi:hypothetical protein